MPRLQFRNNSTYDTICSISDYVILEQLVNTKRDRLFIECEARIRIYEARIRNLLPEITMSRNRSVIAR